MIVGYCGFELNILKVFSITYGYLCVYFPIRYLLVIKLLCRIPHWNQHISMTLLRHSLYQHLSSIRLPERLTATFAFEQVSNLTHTNLHDPKLFNTNPFHACTAQSVCTEHRSCMISISTRISQSLLAHHTIHGHRPTHNSVWSVNPSAEPNTAVFPAVVAALRVRVVYELDFALEPRWLDFTFERRCMADAAARVVSPLSVAFFARSCTSCSTFSAPMSVIELPPRLRTRFDETVVGNERQ